MSEQAIRSLETIFAQAVHLAADRLCDMNIQGLEPGEFDRGARSIGVLLRAAQQATQLKDQVEHDVAAKQAAPTPLTPKQIEALRADIEEKYAQVLQSEDICEQSFIPSDQQNAAGKTIDKQGAVERNDGAKNQKDDD